MFLRRFFGGDDTNPANAAMPYFNQIPDILKKYLGPYAQAGQNILPDLEAQYNTLTNDPTGFINRMGEGYQKSPGYDFALKQGEQAINHAQAAGGMAGSPQHEQLAAQLAENLANQDFNNWLSKALGAYGMGIGGKANIYGMGGQMGSNLAENLSSNLMNQGGLAFQGQANQNQQWNDMLKMAMNAAMMGAML